MPVKSMIEIAHDFLLPVLHSQAVCIDATLGLGRDSRFFLEQGVFRVFAWEVQKHLLEQSVSELASSRLIPFLKGHEYMLEELSAWKGRIDAVIFNFGYDPHHLQGISTLPETSVQAVLGAIELLRPRGRMALVFYSKPPGEKERQCVMKALEEQNDLDLLECSRPDRSQAPILVCVEKRGCPVFEKLK